MGSTTKPRATMLSKLVFTALPALAAVVSSVAAAPQGQVPLVTEPGKGEVIDLTKYTIAQILNYSLHHQHHDEKDDNSLWRFPGSGGDHARHHPSIHKLAYFVNRSEPVKEYLAKEDISVTLFAPDDDALTPPEHHHGMLADNDRAEGHPEDHPFYTLKEDHDGDKDDEEKRRKINMLITALLKYHVAPEKYTVEQLLDKQTIGTILQQTKDADEPFRIRSGNKFNLIPPRYELVLNFYAKKRPGPSILAKNGIIHLMSAPLFPSLTPFDILLEFPLTFSTLTSAIQQGELDGALAQWYHHYDDKDHKDELLELANLKPNEASASVMSVLEEMVDEAREAFGLPKSDEFAAFPFTIFAPTNLAVVKVPFKIRLFLFSPFGRGILKKLLAYHVVPQFIFHTDHIVNATRPSKKSDVTGYLGGQTIRLPSWLLSNEEADETIFGGFSSGMTVPGINGVGKADSCDVEKFVLPTLLGKAKNETLAVNVYTFREGLGGKGPLKKKVTVGNLEQEEKEYVSVAVTDVPAWGGAIHVVNSFIKPPFAHHHHGDHDGDDEHKFVKHGGKKHGAFRGAYAREQQLNYYEELFA